MIVAVKTVNFTAESGYGRYGEILYHTQVRWLSDGNVLRRF